MPSHLHETLVEMFRDRPSLAPELLRGPLHIAVPDFDEARLSPGDLTDVKPTEYRADAVVTLTDAGRAVLAIVIEVQLRTDSDKRRKWPAYAATLHARLGCPVALGPRQVPLVTDLDAARRVPELAVLSAMAHGARPDPKPVFHALLTALNSIDEDHGKLYTDIVLSVLPAAARVCLEEFMTTTSHQYQSDFARRYVSEGEARGKAEGKAEGRANAILTFLDARGIEVPDDVRAKIVDCADLDRLDQWIRQAATARGLEDLDL